VVGIFVSINVVLNSLKCTVTPFFFSKLSRPLLVLCILSKTKQILNVSSFNFIAISTQIRSNFSTNVGIYDLQLSFCEANFTWRNDITYKNVLNKPVCDEINKSTLSRVPHVTYFIPCNMKADFALHNQTFQKHSISNKALSLKRARWPLNFLLFWDKLVII